MLHAQENKLARSDDGRALSGWLCAGVVAACLGAAALAPDASDAARMTIRLTARTSLLLFLIAFSASSVDRLWPSPATRWLRANRRRFGLAFAFSHLMHGVAILALSEIDPVLFDELTAPIAFIAGGMCYLVIALMTMTSFHRISATVGSRMRGIIHGGGVWFVALFFLVNFGRRAVVAPEMYWPYMALLAAAITVRIAARILRPEAQTVA